MGGRMRAGMLALLATVCVSGSLSAAFGQCLLGEVRWVAFNFAPKGWAIAQGQVLPINQNQALFSLLGVNYGGDGKVTFALPDLQAVGPGQGSLLMSRTVSVKSGAKSPTAPAGAARQRGLVPATAKTPPAPLQAGPKRTPVVATSAPGGPKQVAAPLTPIICLQGFFPERQ